MADKLESRIRELESTVFFLQTELSSITTILDEMFEPEQKFPWRQTWIDDDSGGHYEIKPVKVFPAKERNLLIKEFHNQGLSVKQIAVALLERNHRNSKGGIWSDSIIEKVISKFEVGNNDET